MKICMSIFYNFLMLAENNFAVSQKLKNGGNEYKK